MRQIKKIRKQLFKELESLKDERGLIQAGFPHYNRFFGRDSLIVSWQLLNINPDICKETLEALSKLQGKKINKEREEDPGKILHETDFKRKEHPESRFPYPYYGSVDSTPLYLILSYFYYQKTKNKKFLKKYWENILSALNWMEKYGDLDKDLFLEYQSKNPKGLFHQGWKDLPEKDFKIQPPIAIVEAQGYQYLALKGTTFLANILKERSLAPFLLNRAKTLKKKFNKAFWLEKEKYFVLALDGKKEKYKAITSNPGQLLFTGILEKEKIDLVVKRLFKSDLWTPFGIRTYSTRESDFNPLSYQKGSVWPHDNWIIAQGLKKLGYKSEYQKIKKATFKAFQKLGYLPELYGVVGKKIVEIPQACYPQAWSSGALLNFLSA